MRSTAAALGLLAATASAQTVTSPPGYAAVEGFRDNRDVFPQTALAARGYAHVDDEIRGMPPATITAMAWRRDGLTATNPLLVARFVDLELVVGEAVWSRVRFDAPVSFPSLYRSPPTVAYTLKPTLLPDWTQAPPMPPAPFDLRVPLDVPTAYSGNDALMYELRSRQPSAFGVHPVDWAGAETEAFAADVRFQEGCAVRGGQIPLLTAMLWRVYGSYRPSLLEVRCSQGTYNAYAVLALGASPANLVLPGFCLPLRNSAELLQVIGYTGGGGFAARLFSLPHDAGYVGVTLRSQLAFVPTGGGVLAMSEGMAVAYPPPLTNVPRLAAAVEPGSIAMFPDSGTFDLGGVAATELTVR